MNVSLLAAIFFFVLLCHLRFRAYTHNYAGFTWYKRWLFMTGYLLVSLVAANLFATEASVGLQEVTINAASEMADYGVTSMPSVLMKIARYYAEYGNSILLTLGALMTAETIVLVTKLSGKLSRSDPPDAASDTDASSERRGGTFRTYWVATLLAIFVGPLLGFSLANLDANNGLFYSHASDERSLMRVSYTLSPFFALYAAPAHWLGATPIHRYWQRGDSSVFSPTYPSDQPVRLTNMVEDAVPWIILSVLISLVATIRTRHDPPYLRPSVRQLLIGNIAWKDVWRLSNWELLPWRGKIIYVALPVITILALVAILLQLSMLAFMAFAYGGWILVVLIVLVVSVIKIGEVVLGVAKRKPPPPDK